MLQTELAEDARFATKTFRFVADSLARNIVAISILAMVGGCIILALIIGRSLSTFISLGVVWFIFKLMITIARIILVENTEHIEGKDVQLFEIIRGTFVVGGLMTAIIVVIHQLILPINVAGFVDRLYMIVLLTLSYPLLRHSDVVAELFLPYVNDRVYLCKTIRLLVFLFPLMIFSNALIGLIGFVNLAWQIAVIEGRITLIICCWLILRGLLDDVMQTFSEWCIRHVANGWLWTQAVLRPLHNILLIALGLLGGVLCLFALDMDFDAPIVQQAGYLLINPLIKVGQTDITLMSILFFIAGFAIVSWAAKWSREFSYRWFYRSVKDSGVRDSLAVFTQYGVVVIGFFAILHVLGIDLTTLTVVAAAFSIGIAFGVRDIVNNVISGLLLLIERPVRKGDWIQVSNYEGEVTQIGLRAITIQTGQNTEVIVPNTDTMIKPFTNWTRQDSIIRSQFEIKIPLHDNPTWVREVIRDAVATVEGVVSQPAIDVLLTDVTDCGFLVEVRYYVDLRSNTARSRIKSEVITSVWHALKKEGVRLPLQEHLVHICE